MAIKLLGLSTVAIGPLSATTLAAGGTVGNDVSNSTLGTNIPSLLVAQVASTTANGSVDTSFSRATESVSLANVNLLNGLITAQALTGSTTSSAPRGCAVISTASSKLVNLTIGGVVISINVGPNTSITIPGVVTVTINRQVRTATGITQQILDIKVLGGSLPLPIGAEIQVGTTNTWVGTAG